MKAATLEEIRAADGRSEAVLLYRAEKAKRGMAPLPAEPLGSVVLHHCSVRGLRCPKCDSTAVAPTSGGTRVKKKLVMCGECGYKWQSSAVRFGPTRQVEVRG